MKAEDKLRVWWSKKEEDFMISPPSGIGTKSDGHLMHSHFFYNKTSLGNLLHEELESRGYDITTMKFSIEPKKGDYRFSSQIPENHLKSLEYAKSMGMI
ncbi:hypothetical protein KAR91_15255 [Candidatus Pacearchaeota archaeon]|nr:hypothetical protein [Candidatus Pacearchaeota archaeon]